MNRDLASWLVARRPDIERVMNRQLGAAAPAPGDPESEALRRFRSFAAAALLRGQAGAPALDGVRSHERRIVALLRAWSEAAQEVAGPDASTVRKVLDPLVDHFRLALRKTQSSRRASGAPRSTRRAVSAAIDRVADAFLAIDVDSGQIVDANPAAGALLSVRRDALLGVDVMRFVPEDERGHWWTELESVCEVDEARHFHAGLQDAAGARAPVHASLTRFLTRGRALALVLARPVASRLGADATPGPLTPPAPPG